MRTRVSGFLLLALCASFSCKHAPEPERMQGEYVFQYPSGHVEVLRLDEDSTYRQELYPSLDSFQSSDSVMFTNEGTWSLSKGEITLAHRLHFSGGGGPVSPSLAPGRGTIANIGWIAPTPTDSALLEFTGDYSYYFIRIDKRSEIPRGLIEQAARRRR